MKKTIYLDMDGTFVNLYDVEHWLFKLRAEDPTPYTEAKPLVNFSVLARYLNNQKKRGNNIGIISWTSYGGSEEYNKQVAEAKREYLRKHLPSVSFDEIIIVPYGEPKSQFRKSALDVLIDDDVRNLEDWGAYGYHAEDLLKLLKEIK